MNSICAFSFGQLHALMPSYRVAGRWGSGRAGRGHLFREWLGAEGQNPSERPIISFMISVVPP
jgi:hypothetical protein